MTTIKTDDLTPRQINMLVAVIEGLEQPAPGKADGWLRVCAPHYCSSHVDAGRIIDREHITTIWGWGSEHWVAGYQFDGTTGEFHGPQALGCTRLEAAMRAYVRKVYGETITTTDKPWLLEAAAS